jgi:hypothetical protein
LIVLHVLGGDGSPRSLAAAGLDLRLPAQGEADAGELYGEVREDGRGARMLCAGRQRLQTSRKIREEILKKVQRQQNEKNNYQRE